MNVACSAKESRPTPERLLVEAVERLAEVESRGLNGYGLEMFSLPLPNEGMCTPLARILNRTFRYQLSPANQDDFAIAASQAEAANLVEYGEAPAPDLVKNSFGSAGQSLTLYCNLPRETVLEALDEALLHPERGTEARHVDLERRMWFNGLDGAVGTLDLLERDLQRDIVEAIDGHDDRKKVRAIGELDQVSAAQNEVGQELARSYERLHSQDEWEALAVLTPRSDIGEWIQDSPERDARAKRIIEALRAFQ